MTTTDHSRSDRARFPEAVRSIYDTLTNGTDPQQTPFETLKDVFMMAACIGFLKCKPLPLAGPRGEPIRIGIFTEKDLNILKAIAVAHMGSVDVLEKRADEMVSGTVLDIVEEFAHAGVLEMKSLILDKNGASLWNLVDVIKSV